MKCPKCGTKLPNNLQVRCRPVEIRFNMGIGSDGTLHRISEFEGRELFNIDQLASGTHVTTCSNCSTEIDITTIEIAPVCAVCGNERASLSATNNLCHYDGLVCMSCAKTRLVSHCGQCSRTSRCALYARVIKKQE